MEFIQKFLTTPNTKKSHLIFWFTLSMTFATIYGIQAIIPGLNNQYMIFDDGRAHIFWMDRFMDPELFPNDLIADYFQSVSPLGFTALYKVFATLGIQPILLSKILPFFLGLIATAYCFGVCFYLLPVPALGFFGCLLFNQSFWLDSTLISGLAKAFVYPLFMAFLYYLLKKSLYGIAISIALLGLFYIPSMLVAAGMLTIKLLINPKKNYLVAGVGLGVSLIIIAPYLLPSTSEFGSLITREEARSMAEFYSGGRARFFYDNNPVKFWLQGSRSGIRLSLNPASVTLGLLLPIMLQFPRVFPLVKEVKKEVVILVELLISSLGLFFMAHAFLYQLLHPSRYTIHSLRIIMAIASGIVLILLLDSLLHAAKKIPKLIPLGITFLLTFVVIFYPNLFWNKDYFPKKINIVGLEPKLYEFFQQQPKDTMIASLSFEADNLPTFTKRSVLIAKEHAIPYHLDYYNQIRQRATDLIYAQYSPNLELVRDFIKTYNIRYILLDENAFTKEYLDRNFWFQQWDLLAETISISLEKNTPALVNTKEKCSVYQSNNFIVIDASCILTNN